MVAERTGEEMVMLSIDKEKMLMKIRIVMISRSKGGGGDALQDKEERRKAEAKERNWVEKEVKWYRMKKGPALPL